MQTAFTYKSIKSAKQIAFIFVLAIFSIIVPMSAAAQKGGRGGGGGGGDAFITTLVYSSETCPIPAETRNDYLLISFCGLGKMSRDPNNFVILLDGYTSLLPGSKNVNATVNVVLPCGNLATFSRYQEVSFAQTLPPPPPYRLQTLTTKVPDTCPH